MAPIKVIFYMWIRFQDWGSDFESEFKIERFFFLEAFYWNL